VTPRIGEGGYEDYKVKTKVTYSAICDSNCIALERLSENMALVQLGFGMGIPWVGIFHTVPIFVRCLMGITQTHGIFNVSLIIKYYYDGIVFKNNQRGGGIL
jgi:hypothetical protein